MKTLCRWVCLIAFITPSLRAQGPFMNDTLPVTVPAGETNTVVAQTGTGVVDKAGSGLLILQDPGLFNGIVRLREGALHADVSGATPATRPDTILEPPPSTWFDDVDSRPLPLHTPPRPQR